MPLLAVTRSSVLESANTLLIYGLGYMPGIALTPSEFYSQDSEPEAIFVFLEHNGCQPNKFICNFVWVGIQVWSCQARSRIEQNRVVTLSCYESLPTVLDTGVKNLKV